ncbi:MAG TPA: GNAT family N-acetyltransferase [Oscillatoriaceae cyanobacterium]
MVRLESERLILRLPDEDDVPAIVRYLRENDAFHKPYNPPAPDDFLTEEFQLRRVRSMREDFAADRALRLFLFKKAEPARVIGQLSFSAIQRGPAQYCNLGYHQAQHEQGQGHMREGLPVAIAYAFENLQLHRIQANYMPTNERSGRLLRSLGFVVEGYARDYLFIDGAWRDHVLTSLTNPGLVAPIR